MTDTTNTTSPKVGDRVRITERVTGFDQYFGVIVADSEVDEDGTELWSIAIQFDEMPDLILEFAGDEFVVTEAGA